MKTAHEPHFHEEAGMFGRPEKRIVFVALVATIVLVAGTTSGVAAGYGSDAAQAPLASKASGTPMSRAYLPFLGGPFDCSQVTDVPPIECQALVALYYTANGHYWYDQAGWLAGRSACTWAGVACLGGHVSVLYLTDNQLSGTIPPELGNLTGLYELDLDTNQLTGTMPSQLGNLTGLYVLDLSKNQLAGPMPLSLDHLSLLSAFFFDSTVCEPNNAAFETWLSGIEDHSPATLCGTGSTLRHSLLAVTPEKPGGRTASRRQCSR